MIDIDNIVLFASYICVADGLVDDKQVRLIENFFEENNISAETKENVKKILSDSDDKIDFDQILLALKNAGKDTLRQSLIIGLNIAYTDGFFDPAEESLFQKFIDDTEYDKQDYLNIKESIIKKLSSYKAEQDIYEENILDNVVKNFLFTIKKISSGKMKQNIESAYNKFLLKGKEYAEAIEETSQIARNDLSITTDIINKMDTSYKELLDEINKIMNDNKKYENSKDETEKQFYNLLKNFQEELKDIVINRLEHNKRTIKRKERASNFYTISFIGKTKAGKSTLHSVITGNGNEYIGAGQQRTTRYNRMYEWERIRLIDTPGIGAPGGKTDEQIAKSVIDESDLICYVLKNDSIQESEFKFLKTIKEHNKPVVILLNVKENIENQSRLKIYLKDPEKWYKRKDEKALDGHINRIKRYANEHYNNGYFKIFPVQLLAARMANEEQNEKNSSILYKSSHIEDFLNSLRVQIIDEGKIKRTQTMIDGSIHTLNESLKKLKEYEEILEKLKNKLSENKKNIVTKIEKAFKNKDGYYTKLENALRTRFSYLKEKDAWVFANQNYNTDKEEIADKWDSYFKQIKFNDKIKSEVENVTKEYSEEIKKILKDFEEDLNLFSKFKLQNMKFETKNTFNFKTLSSLFSGAASVAGTIILTISMTNPVGLIITGIGFVGFLVTNKFKSKQKRIEKAKEKLYTSIYESIEENENKLIKNTLDKFKKKHNENKQSISENIDKLSNSVNLTISQIKPLIKRLENNIQYLNKIYAGRIINYIEDKNETEIDFNKIENIEVKRDYGKEFHIKTTNNIKDKDEEKISNILQEKILLS